MTIPALLAGAAEVTRPSPDDKGPVTFKLGVSSSCIIDERRLHLAYRTYAVAFGQEHAARLYPQLVQRLYECGYVAPLGPATTFLRKLFALDGINGVRIQASTISTNHVGIGRLLRRTMHAHVWMMDQGVPRIKDGIFSSGAPIAVERVKAHGVNLLLSTNRDLITRYVAEGGAGAVITHLKRGQKPPPYDSQEPLIIGFDFDRVLAFARHPDDPTGQKKDAEDYFNELRERYKGENNGLEKTLQDYRIHLAKEGRDNIYLAHFADVLRTLYTIQKRVGKNKLQLRIVTARDDSEQIEAALEALGIPADVEVECMAGQAKAVSFGACDIAVDDLSKNLGGARLAAEVPAAGARQMKTYPAPSAA